MNYFYFAEKSYIIVFSPLSTYKEKRTHRIYSIVKIKLIVYNSSIRFKWFWKVSNFPLYFPRAENFNNEIFLKKRRIHLVEINKSEHILHVNLAFVQFIIHTCTCTNEIDDWGKWTYLLQFLQLLSKRKAGRRLWLPWYHFSVNKWTTVKLLIFICPK